AHADDVRAARADHRRAHRRGAARVRARRRRDRDAACGEGRLRRLAVILAIACAAAPLVAEETERGIRDRTLAAAGQADQVALLVGRLVVEKRWNELLDAMMFAIAPRGAWDASHPAWAAARKALAGAMQRASVVRYERETSRLVHDVVLDHYLDALDDD